jgi:hypothetical protein
MKAYSMDLRKRVLADSDAGLPKKQLAERYGVSRTWVPPQISDWGAEMGIILGVRTVTPHPR